MADYKAKKVIFKNRDNEYLIPYIDNVYTKEEIDELLKDVPSGGGETSGGGDTIPLYTGMYFDFTPNNISWLGAGVQKSGKMYETAYNGLVKALNASMGVSTLASATITENITPTKVGTVNDDPIETQAYYFSENDYLTTTLEVGSEPFELQFKFTTPADVTTAQIVASTEYAEITLGISNGRFYYYSFGEENFAQCLPSTAYTCAIGRANGMTYYKVSTDNGNTWTTQENAYPFGDTTVTLNFGKPNDYTEKGAISFKGVIDLTSFVLTSTKTQEETTDIIFDGKVVDVEAMVDGVDYSEYWKVDINTMTFTTPTAISNKALSGAVVGNGMTLGITNGTQNGGIYTGSDSEIIGSIKNYGSNVGVSRTTAKMTEHLTVGITSDPTKSGIIAEQSTAQLYFKVANAVQNLELLDAGYILENMVDKQNMSAVSVCIEEYVNGTSWYRIYSDVGNGKWCEQGGQFTGYSEDNIISLLKSYKDTTYSVQATAVDKRHIVGALAKTTTSIQFTVGQSSTSSSNTLVDWVAKGYLA